MIVIKGQMTFLIRIFSKNLPPDFLLISTGNIINQRFVCIS